MKTYQHLILICIQMGMNAYFIVATSAIASDQSHVIQTLYILNILLTITLTYTIFSWIQSRRPRFLERSFHMEAIPALFVGMVLFLGLMIGIIFIVNSVELTGVMNRLSTVLFSYPLVIVLMWTTYMFSKPIFHVSKEKRLFFSAAFLFILICILLLLPKLVAL